MARLQVLSHFQLEFRGIQRYKWEMLMTHVPNYFHDRRSKLMAGYPNAGFILPSHPQYIRNSDVYHPYRQDSNLHYLTGFDEAESCLVLAPAKSASGFRTILFVAEKDPEKEMWEGERYGIEGALKVFKANESYPIQELAKRLPELLSGVERVFYRIGFDTSMDGLIISALESHRKKLGRTGRSLLALEDPSGPIGEMRLFKTGEEVEIMRKACNISARAHRAAMKEVRPGMNEYEVEALVDYFLRKNGCQRVGYGSIVAGGRNSTCLHYRSNNAVLQEGDLLLIDAGGELDHYSADITRTFPVSKKFNQAQASTYDLVLRAQKEGIAMARPGVRLPEIHRHVCDVMIDGLLSLGLLKGKADEIFKSGQHRRFYPHNTSHWLGMDVHDAGLYFKKGEPRPLEAGMVLTIEPGFYVQPSDQDAPVKYQNIGIRIEDDILITESGCEVLTQEAPKEREEIEALRA